MIEKNTLLPLSKLCKFTKHNRIKADELDGDYFPIIHDDLWEKYLRLSFDSILWYKKNDDKKDKVSNQIYSVIML